MPARATDSRIYDGDGDQLMAKHRQDLGDRITLVPDAMPSKAPDRSARIRIMWGQHLLEDLLLGRYKTLVCAVNGDDNSRGIISQLAQLLPTSQWDNKTINAYASHFTVNDGKPRVLKFDMDMVEVLAILRPAGSEYLTVSHLAHTFRIVADMLRTKPRRLPSASVSFLGARANALVDQNGDEPSFETVLRTMFDAGYTGDVYPPPTMWAAKDIGLFARYPFPKSLDKMRAGGY